MGEGQGVGSLGTYPGLGMRLGCHSDIGGGGGGGGEVVMFGEPYLGKRVSFMCPCGRKLEALWIIRLN